MTMTLILTKLNDHVTIEGVAFLKNPGQVTLRLGLGGVKELRVQSDFCSQVPDDEEVSLLSLGLCCVCFPVTSC